MLSIWLLLALAVVVAVVLGVVAQAVIARVHHLWSLVLTRLLWALVVQVIPLLAQMELAVLIRCFLLSLLLAVAVAGLLVQGLVLELLVVLVAVVREQTRALLVAQETHRVLLQVKEVLVVQETLLAQFVSVVAVVVHRR